MKNIIIFTFALFLLHFSIDSFSKAEKENDVEEEHYRSWRKSCLKKDFGCSVWCQENSVPGWPFFCGGVCQGWFQNKCSCVFCPPGTEFLFPYPNIYPWTRGRPDQKEPPKPHPEPEHTTQAPGGIKNLQFMAEAIAPVRRIYGYLPSLF